MKKKIKINSILLIVSEKTGWLEKMNKNKRSASQSILLISIDLRSFESDNLNAMY